MLEDYKMKQRILKIKPDFNVIFKFYFILF